MDDTQSIWHSSGDWVPTTFVRLDQSLDTSMGTARVQLDNGAAYLKAMGNRQGPHCLAAELIGTQLATWIGLETVECALINIDDEVDEIEFLRGGKAVSGPAFVSRAMKGRSWSGKVRELKQVVNQQHFALLTVFDTWTLNVDRHPPDLNSRRPNYDNVFLEFAEPVPKKRLKAIDHSHCFKADRDLTPSIADIGVVKDERVHGLFPEYKEFITRDSIFSAVEALKQFERRTAEEVIESVPGEWEVDTVTRDAIADFLVRRAAFLSDDDYLAGEIEMAVFGERVLPYSGDVK